jgi:hypothetical protein
MNAHASPRNLLVGALALGLATTGCSYMVSRPPPARPLVSPDECSRSRGPVVGDVIGAIETGSVAVLFLGAAGIQYVNNTEAVVPSWDAHPLSVDKALLIGSALSVAATAAFIASAGHGLDSARACDAARLDLYWRSGTPPPQPPPPPKLPPQPWPAR